MPLSGSFVVFDTETTGLDSNTERLTEIGAVYVENGKINEEKKFCSKTGGGEGLSGPAVDCGDHVIDEVGLTAVNQLKVRVCFVDGSCTCMALFRLCDPLGTAVRILYMHGRNQICRTVRRQIHPKSCLQCITTVSASEQ